MPNTLMKRITSTALTLSVLSIKGLEATIPTMIAMERDPSACFQGLIASVGMATITAPFAIKDENKWVDKSKFLGLIPWGLLVTGAAVVGPELYPAAWFLASFGSDYILALVNAYQNYSALTAGDLTEIGIEGIKRALLAALILTDGPPGAVLAAIKQNMNITPNQFYLATSAAAVSVSSFAVSSGRAVYNFFKRDMPIIQNETSIEMNKGLAIV